MYKNKIKDCAQTLYTAEHKKELYVAMDQFKSDAYKIKELTKFNAEELAISKALKEIIKILDELEGGDDNV